MALSWCKDNSAYDKFFKDWDFSNPFFRWGSTYTDAGDNLVQWVYPTTSKGNSVYNKNPLMPPDLEAGATMMINGYGELWLYIQENQVPYNTKGVRCGMTYMNAAGYPKWSICTVPDYVERWSAPATTPTAYHTYRVCYRSGYIDFYVDGVLKTTFDGRSYYQNTSWAKRFTYLAYIQPVNYTGAFSSWYAKLLLAKGLSS
jgi:hypothetical protein